MPMAFANIAVVFGVDQRVSYTIFLGLAPVDAAAEQAFRLEEERAAKVAALVARIQTDPFFAAMVRR
ncbi:uncharacterized protein B0H18DRAFT_1129888 [Fomitopsis serialis]|uniref:uncharacterized protein n=1 Tax=Fomitopsis serialis TaxID=139415 RepID=UPI0020082D48|nr:uncharacterized protein B0H18DRAFT_1129888 [Neoantrodia serialis]KAH9910537.1 hypothetical protein B0H18DRAFT_1129888 [Neoantrodia serialis]